MYVCVRGWAHFCNEIKFNVDDWANKRAIIHIHIRTYIRTYTRTYIHAHIHIESQRYDGRIRKGCQGKASTNRIVASVYGHSVAT